METNNYLEFGGKYYCLNLDKFMEFCNCEQNLTNSVVQKYITDDDGNMSLIDKEIGETKESVNEVISNYRYNTITNLLNMIMMPITDGSGSGIMFMPENPEGMHFGQKLAFNTLVEMEIIYEIETEE